MSSLIPLQLLCVISYRLAIELKIGFLGFDTSVDARRKLSHARSRNLSDCLSIQQSLDTENFVSSKMNNKNGV